MPGTYILEPKVLDFLPAGENYSFEYGLFPDLLKRSEPFYAHIPSRTYWIDIGTPERYLQVHADLLANRVGRIHIKERRGQFDAATVAEIDDLSIDRRRLCDQTRSADHQLGAGPGMLCRRARACRELRHLAAHANRNNSTIERRDRWSWLSYRPVGGSWTRNGAWRQDVVD